MTLPSNLKPHAPLLMGLVEQVPRPVFATISGAHLYGFESPDSDVDLRGAFVEPLESVLGVGDRERTVSLMSLESGVELDWVAHDVRKSLRLIARGSGEVMEQVLSPLVLMSSSWHEELKEITRACVTRRAHHHYAGFLHSRRRLIEGESPTVKVLLYAYRAGLTGVHALRTGEVCAHLPALLESYPQDGVLELIERKRNGQEKGALEPGEADHHRSALDALEARLERAHDASPLPEAITPESPLHSTLNDFLIRIRTATDDR